MAADVQEVLRCWQVRLRPGDASSPGKPGSGSHTFDAVLKALLKSRALHVALAALTRSRAGRAVLHAAADSSDGIGPAGSNAAPVEQEAGRLLKVILADSCAVPMPLIKQLLTLLSDAAEEKILARKQAGDGGSPTSDLGSAADVSAQDVQWVLALLSGSLLDISEVGPQEETEALSQAVDTALEKPAAAGHETEPDSAELEVGSEVWASWPGDGRWFRAKVTGHVSSSQIDVAWLRRGADGTGEADEYLSSTGGDELQFTRLQQTAVVKGDARPKHSAGAPQEHWQQQLARAEECSRKFRELRKVCEKLPNDLSRQTASSEPLQSLAEQLSGLREENELRAGALLSAAEARANAGGGINQQLTSSSKSFEVEIESMQQEQEALRSRVRQLQQEREELAAKLQALDEQLEVAMLACSEAVQREQQVRASAKRVAGELKRELSMEEVAARRVGERQRLLLEAGAASRDIEALLTSRAKTAAAKDAARQHLAQQQPKAEAACLQSEKERSRLLEELLAGWQAAVWGPDAEALPRNVELLAKLKAAHVRAGGIVQQAWKETVQMAAQSLGEGDTSEGISRAAERYKEMLKDIKSNLERLKTIEAKAVRQEFAPQQRKPEQASKRTSAAPAAGQAAGAGSSPAAAEAPAATAQADAARPDVSRGEAPVADQAELVASVPVAAPATGEEAEAADDDAE
eukprot:TRINITY_DN61926_c0_g1_i1.p1 TRINITY_DN61926_c0_g1~~TRINITY_DN61926_c0_g1_i1.p1  ORF type:complete len:693 (+),score=222.23 TRINITY_DN61926_c0_g1_i1:345-2423(+)